MSEEKVRRSSAQIGTLGGCLIEGDSEQKARERKVRRRALTISVALQSAVIVALVLVPLLGRTEKLPFTIVTPMPPYRRPPARSPEQPTNPTPPKRTCGFCAPTQIPPTIVTHDNSTSAKNPDESGTIELDRDFTPPGSGFGIDVTDGRNQPTPPEDPDKNKKKRISVGGAVQQAMLVNRVAPIYPALARQLHRAGQVHLRALIAVDGSIESLQVIDGDPLLIQSALDAVGQWRYRPTLLNGNPVEVETIITVIYTLNQ